MNFKLSFTLLITLTCLVAKGQELTPHEHTHHHEHKNEFGIANAPVYFIKEKVFAYGLHMHFVRTISESKFGLGVGYERIFDEHEHSTYGIVLAYSPIEFLHLNVAPGLTMEKGQSTPNFALHLESSYEYEVGDFHVGPVFEIAYDPEDIHISIGLHLGFGF